MLTRKLRALRFFFRLTVTNGATKMLTTDHM